MDKFGRFPSHYAAERGNADCLDTLAEYDEVEFIFQQMLDKSKVKVTGIFLPPSIPLRVVFRPA